MRASLQGETMPASSTQSLLSSTRSNEWKRTPQRNYSSVCCARARRARCLGFASALRPIDPRPATRKMNEWIELKEKRFALVDSARGAHDEPIRRAAERAGRRRNRKKIWFFDARKCMEKKANEILMDEAINAWQQQRGEKRATTESQKSRGSEFTFTESSAYEMEISDALSRSLMNEHWLVRVCVWINDSSSPEALA